MSIRSSLIAGFGRLTERFRFENRETAPTSSVWYTRYPYAFKAGSRVTPDEALTIASVWRAVDFLSKTLAALPLEVRKSEGAGKSTLVEESPVVKLMNKRSNEEMTAMQFRTVMWWTALTYGSAFAEIVRDRAGRPTELWYLTPSRVTIKRDELRGYKLYYEVQGDGIGETVDMEPRDILHLRANAGYDGIVPYSPVAYALRTLGVSISLDEFAASFFANGAAPSGILQHPKRLTAPTKKRVLKSWAQMLLGPKRSLKTIILDEGVTWQQVSIDADKAQSLESRKFQVLEVCRIFGIPPNKLYDWDNTAYDKLELANREFATDTVVPHCVGFEQEIDLKLLGGNFGGLFSKFDLNELMRGSLADRVRYYEGMSKIGGLSIDEVRARENMNPIPGGETHLVAANNYLPLDLVLEGKSPAAQQYTQDGEPGDGEGDDDDDNDEDLTEEERELVDASAKFMNRIHNMIIEQDSSNA